MDERTKFVMAVKREEGSIADLCRRFGVSRPTGYKWLERYEASGVAGLSDQNRCVHRRPHAMSEEVRRALVALREKDPGWGPKKLKVVLSRTRTDVPAASTIGELLSREGLPVKRRRRRSPEPFTEPLAHAVETNDVWSIDYKGWFRTADGRRCDPLTVSPLHSASGGDAGH